MASFPTLVADIGGTHARFAWAQSPGQAPAHLMTLKVSEFESPLLAVVEYFSSLKQTLAGEFLAPRTAAFAVAATVSDDEVAFTNSKWAFSC
jgi:glucokinase